MRQILTTGNETACTAVKTYGHFGDIYCPYLLGRLLWRWSHDHFLQHLVLYRVDINPTGELYLTWTVHKRGTRRSWCKHCATSRKVAGSIPDGVTEIFRRHNPSGRTMTLGLTQLLTETSTRNISCGKGDRCVQLTLPPSCADCVEIWESQIPVTLTTCPGL
jgi:hypothetical protein